MSTYQVRSLEESEQIIREHERKTKTNYSLLRSTKNFGCVDVPSCLNEENEVRFETVGVPYCGVPFFVAGLKILQCQSYRGRGRKKKEVKIELTGVGAGVISEVSAMEQIVEDDEPPNARGGVGACKKRKKLGRAQRAGCTATIIMKEVIYYPEFQLFDHSKNNRIAIARQLKETLKARNPVQKDRIIYITVPAVSDHFGHTVGVPPSTPTGAAVNNKRLYVKTDFHGHNQPGVSRRVYYPVKREKIGSGASLVPQLSARLKIERDEEEVQGKAKEVREVLQAIMGLTYKQPGSCDAYRELYHDLTEARNKYQMSLEVSSVQNDTDSHFSAGNSIDIVSNKSVVTVAESWPQRLLTSTTITVPVVLAPASTTGSGTGVGVVGGEGGSNNQQETSIFIEAMEAILNSQI